ncbi:MAG: TonB-dependent receptor [Lacibacter sp.]
MRRIRRLPGRITALVAAIFFLFANSLYAQNKTVNGVVKNEEGEPLANATVSVRGTKIAVLTDKDGKYSLKVTSDKAVITVSFIGMKSVTDIVGNRTVVNFVLVKDKSDLDEVVVVGYGTVRKKDLTGTVGRVSVSDVQKAPVQTVDQALGGRVAGVQVISQDGTPGSNAEITIRGVGSVTQSSAPLYVIDGFPQEAANFNSINPADIESIEVLKDASSTAIYGARGSNGVILITTKRGKSSKPVLSYNGYYGIQQPTKLMKLMSPYEFVRLQNDANPLFANAVYFANGKTLEDYKNEKGIDWQDLLFNDVPTFQNHNISLSAKLAKTAYTISASYGDMDGLIIKSGFKRYQARLTLDQDVTDKLKVGINANYANYKSWGQIPANQSTPPGQGVNTANWNFMSNLWSFRPVLGPNDYDNSIYENLLDLQVGGVVNGRVNPYVQAINEVNDRFNNTLTANAYINLKITKSITLRSTVGINQSKDENYKFYNSNTNSGSPLTSYGKQYGVNGSMYTSKNYSFLNENTVTYDKSFNKANRLTALAGFTWQKFNNEGYGFSSTNLPNESLGYKGLGQGTPYSVSSTSSLSAIASFLGRVNYTFRDNILLTGSFRADGTSKFYSENRWGYFPSGAIAWRFGNEKFFKKISFINDGKIRFTYGATGNNRVSDFAYLSLLTANTSTLSGSYYPWNNQIMYNIVVSTMANKNLKWETGVQTDIGLEMSFLHSRISFEADYYNRVTKDLLLNASMPYSTGFSSAYMNIGKVSNRGFEFSLNTVNVTTKNFRWTSNFNISFNQNKLLALNSGEDALLTIRAFDASVGSMSNYIAKVGQPIAQFYGLVSAGMYQLSDYYKLPNGSNGFVYVLKEGVPVYNLGRNPGNLVVPETNNSFVTQPGSPKFVDINGDGKIDANDYTVIGNPYPKHYGGFNNNFSYKGFDVNIFLQWSYGNQVLNANRMRFENSTAGNGFPTAVNSGLINYNMFASYANRWTPENPSDKYPSINATTEGLRQYSTRIIEDGSFLRIKTVQLGYTIPARLLKNIKLSTARVYVSAQNLFTFTKYSGPDPEVSLGGSNLTPGYDFSPYPRTKVYTFGINLSL